MMDNRSWRMGGGLNLTAPPIARNRTPGSLIGCLNYESRLEGYRRIDGYERFDGRPSPSTAEKAAGSQDRRDTIQEVPGKGDILGIWRYQGRTYAFRHQEGGTVKAFRSSPTGWRELSLGSLVSFEGGSGVPLAEGTVITGQGSNASARVNALIVESGNWEHGTASGWIVVDPTTENRFLNGELIFSGRAAASDDGLTYSGTLYAAELANSGLGYTPGKGVLTQLSDSPAAFPTDADIRSLSLSGSNVMELTVEISTGEDLSAKELVLEDEAFRFDEADKTSGGLTTYRWTVNNVIRARIWKKHGIRVRVRDRGYTPTESRIISNSEVSDQQITSGGGESNFRFITHNFQGQAGQERMYAVTGEGPAFEFDGEIFVELRTGVEDDRPIFVAEHQNHLFLGYRNGSVIHSGLGKPRNFEAIEGAAELTIGDRMTGLVSGYKDSLFVFGRNKTAVLKGTSAADWRLPILSKEAGCMEGSADLLDQPIVFDDRGVRLMTATETFGDFSVATASESIRPYLDFKREAGVIPVMSVRVRNKSQYRLFFSDGDVLVMTIIPRGNFLSREYTISSFDLAKQGRTEPGVVNHACSVEDPDGREKIFFSMKNSGYVYEMDRGSSFDGAAITAYVRFPYNDLRLPHIVKRFRKVQLECDSIYRSRFLLGANFDDDLAEEVPEEFSVQGRSSRWNEKAWDEFEWNSAPERVTHARLSGRGRNVSIVIYSESQPPHTFTGMTVLFDQRKQIR